MAKNMSLLVFAACLSQFTVEGFFYSTGYYPFGHYAPYAPYTHSALGYHHPYAVPTAHHVLPAVSYSGCRNVHGALVPCAFPTPFLTAVEAPAVIEPVAVAPVEEAAAPETAAAAPEAAAEAVAERRKREADADAEADAEADADAYLLYGYGGHHAYPYHHAYAYNHHVPYLGHGLGHHLPHLHGYYAHTGCKNYLGATVPCL